MAPEPAAALSALFESSPVESRPVFIVFVRFAALVPAIFLRGLRLGMPNPKRSVDKNLIYCNDARTNERVGWEAVGGLRFADTRKQERGGSYLRLLFVVPHAFLHRAAGQKPGDFSRQHTTHPRAHTLPHTLRYCTILSPSSGRQPREFPLSGDLGVVPCRRSRSFSSDSGANGRTVSNIKRSRKQKSADSSAVRSQD